MSFKECARSNIMIYIYMCNYIILLEKPFYSNITIHELSYTILHSVEISSLLTDHLYENKCATFRSNLECWILKPSIFWFLRRFLKPFYHNSTELQFSHTHTHTNTIMQLLKQSQVYSHIKRSRFFYLCNIYY